MPSIEEILRAMEKMWERIEEEFAMTKILLNLPETCPIHGVGERDFNLMRYKCPICKKALVPFPSNDLLSRDKFHDWYIAREDKRLSTDALKQLMASKYNLRKPKGR